MAILPRSSSLALLLLLALSLSGCHSSAPLSPAANSDRMASASPDLNLAAIRHVQSLPLYQQAQTLCSQRRYHQAVDLLNRLTATSNLTDLELSFCRQQRDLCLAHTDQLASRKDTKTQSEEEFKQEGRNKG